MAELKVLNELLYEVLADMEDLARSYLDESEEDDKELILFLDKLKSAISKMDKKSLFEDNLISFVSELEPEEEDILFHEVAVAFYEGWQDICQTEDDEDGNNQVENECLVMVSKIIVEILDNYLDYSYFTEEE